MMFSKACKAHLNSVNESGLQHAYQAIVVAIRLQLVIPAVIIHAIIPGLFTNTATNVMKSILEKRHEQTTKR